MPKLPSTHTYGWTVVNIINEITTINMLRAELGQKEKDTKVGCATAHLAQPPLNYITVIYSAVVLGHRSNFLYLEFTLSLVDTGSNYGPLTKGTM